MFVLYARDVPSLRHSDWRLVVGGILTDDDLAVPESVDAA